MDDYYFFDEENKTDFVLYFDNITGLSQLMENFGRGFQISLVVLYALVFFFGMLGNILVIYLMKVKNKQRRLVDIFIIHLAIADLVFLVTLPLWIVSLWLGGLWPFGDFLCKFSSYVILVNMFSSIFFLTCMSIDRFMAIVLALNTRRLRTRRYAHLTILTVWIASLTLGIHGFMSRTIDNEERCQVMVSMTNTVFSLMTRMIAFLLPLLVIAFCYTSIAVKLYQRFQESSKAERKKRRSIRVGLCILSLFVLTWLPFNVVQTLLTLNDSGYLELSQEAFSRLAKGLVVTTCLAFSNSCMNPLVYFWLDSYMQKKVLELLPRSFPSVSTKRSTELSTSTTYPEKDHFSKEAESVRYDEDVQIFRAGTDILQERENGESQF